MKLKNSRILLTGGNGRLGLELRRLLAAKKATVYHPTRAEWDLSYGIFPPDILVPRYLDLIIHTAAYTDVCGAEEDRYECVATNIMGTELISKFARHTETKLVHISSDYVTSHPLGFYAFTKLAAEAFPSPSDDMIVRTSFKPRGMWGPKALDGVFHPVHTNGDWVDVIAEKIIDAIEKDLTGIVNIGTADKTLKDLATQEYADVREIPVETADELVGYHYPRDTRMELTI